MTKIFNKHEVYLFNNYYPILSDIKDSLRPPFAQKQVIGDYTKDSELDKSSITFSDHSGGIGIKEMVEAKHFNRSWFSTCELGYPGHLIPPTRSIDCGNPTTVSANIIIEYANLLYVVFGTGVYTWTEGSATWSALVHSLMATPTSAIVHQGKLYFACGTDFERFDGTNWTDGVTLSSTAIPSLFLLNWDEKLLIVDDTGLLSYSVNEGVAWTANAQSRLEAESFNSLALIRNASDLVVPHLGTKEGLFELDFDSAVWLDTGLSFPRQDFGCKGMIMWRDAAAYIPVGMGIYQYITAANPITINPMGPDRDYGVPKEYRGNIIQLLGEHNAIYALLNSASEIPRDLFTAWPSWDGVIYEDQGYSAVLKWSGNGWSIVKMSGDADAPVTCGAVCSADDKYRLWFSMNKTIWYIPLNINLQNPLELSDYEAENDVEHIWPWFDADNAVVDKLGLNLDVYSSRTSATEYLMIYYGSDYDDNTWTLLTNTAFPDGKIVLDGESSFPFDSGLDFKALRFKAVFHRGTDATKYPDLRWLRLDYMKIPDARWSYDLLLDCTKDYRHKRRSTLVTALKTAVETKTLGDFVYRTIDGISETKKVRIIGMEGYAPSGNKKEGIYQLTLLAP